MICPQCTNEVPLTEAQFLSMYTCPKCQAVYFIDIIGQPEFGDMSLPIPDEPEPEGDGVHRESLETNSFSPLESAELQSNFESEIYPEFQAPELSNDSFRPSLESASEDSNSIKPAALVESISNFNSIALEITDFANQDNSISTLSYDLKVTGLDTKETMLFFREAIDDSKFGWIVPEIFSTIRNGQCELRNLNPIQAFVLAKRIQFLDIETEWKQNVQG